MTGNQSNKELIGNLKNLLAFGSNNANKNVITDSNGDLAIEAKPTIPSASSTTPSADTTNGSIGTATTWAKADHIHPKSSIYLEKSNLLDFVYPIGSIYMSVNNVSPTTFLGGTWVQLTDTFLYASTTADDDVTTAPTGQGEASHTLTTDEMPSHTHTQNSHNHTQNEHNHTQDEHNHEQNEHNHTQNSHNHTQNSHNHTQNSHSHDASSYKFVVTNNLRRTGERAYTSSSSSGIKYLYHNTTDDAYSTVQSTKGTTATNNANTATNIATTATNNATTATNNATTAINNATTATNNATTATNQNTGGGQAHNNMPPYMKVYMWKRTA